MATGSFTNSMRSSSPQIPTRMMAVKIAATYALLGGLWILGSGWLLHQLVHDAAEEALMETLKGWFFVSFTALLLGLALDRYFHAIRHSTQLLQASEERLKFALEHSHIGGWELDLQEHSIRRTPEHDHLFGYESSLSEWSYELFLEHILPEDREEVARQYRQSVADQTDWSFECRIRRKDGEIRWIWVAAGHQKSTTGQPLYINGIIQDITDRKNAEEALHESEMRRSLAMEAAQMGMWDWDLVSGKMVWSETQETLWGFAPGTFPKTVESFSSRIHAEDLQEFWQIGERAKQNKTPFRHEFRVIWPDGSVHWLSNHGRYTYDAEGRAIRGVGVVFETTEHKRLEAQFRQAQKLEAVGQLAGGVAHDFNNILAAIMMNLDLIKMNRDLDSETQQGLAELDRSARRAADLTRQLLMFSRRSVLSVRRLDVNELVANLIKMLGRLIGETIDLRFESRSGLPNIEADSGMLEQVLVNLAVNARDAMSKGGRITISTSAISIDETTVHLHSDRRLGKFICLAVADTGCGMDAETLRQIFDPFFTTKEPGKGTGLGLATVHGIVAQHKGWIEVESAPGAGTTFRIFLPAAAGKVEEKGKTQEDMASKGGSETLLIVEDDPQLRQLLAQVLRKLGYQVVEASNGHEALKLWPTYGPKVDLLLTDMVMPEGMTGLELTERLREIKPDLKAIISSGYSSEIVQAGIPAKSGIIFLPKPYEVGMLTQALQASLTHSS